MLEALLKFLQQAENLLMMKSRKIFSHHCQNAESLGLSCTPSTPDIHHKSATVYFQSRHSCLLPFLFHIVHINPFSVVLLFLALGLVSFFVVVYVHTKQTLYFLQAERYGSINSCSRNVKEVGASGVVARWFQPGVSRRAEILCGLAVCWRPWA